MARANKPIPPDPALRDLIEKSVAAPLDSRSRAISAMQRENPALSRDYVTGRVDGMIEVAEAIAAAITPAKGPKARREALTWAALVARSFSPVTDKQENE